MQVELLQHRGPNNKDFYINKNIGLGHTRLSILDLSEKGNQPMHSQCSRYVITFNGEIYNFRDLRNKVKNIHFKTESDTEVIVEYISAFGIRKTLKSLDGMFAIGIWDKKKRELTIGRDRFGIKPLYWAIIEGSFFFSSELKTFKLIPRCTPRINKASLLDLLQYSCVASPKTIFENIYKLEPGKFITFGENQELKKNEYWNSSSLITNRNIYSNDFDTCKNFIENELEKSIKSTMVSDVPIGAFLSGGVDSSLVTSMMVKLSKRKVQTFSIGFEEEGFNEAHFAKKISNHLKTDHSEAYVSEKDLINVIPLLPEIYCEPFGDSSQIPTYLVSKLSSKKTKVILSGDGADEIFGGYNRYYYAEKIFSFTNYIPFFLGEVISKILIIISKYNNKNYQNFFLRKEIPQFNEKLVKLSKIIRRDENFLYETLISSSLNCSNLINNLNLTIKNTNKFSERLDFFESMQFLDLNNYLQNDILTKVDRASMFCSQEVRVPFLNLNIVNAGWSLPKEFKKNKIILKRILEQYVPNKLFDRPKMGFGIPLERWLTGCLKDWMLSTLNPKKVKEQGFFNESNLMKLLANNSAIKNNKYLIWNILMFQCWYDNYLK